MYFIYIHFVTKYFIDFYKIELTCYVFDDFKKFGILRKVIFPFLCQKVNGLVWSGIMKKEESIMAAKMVYNISLASKLATKSIFFTKKSLKTFP